jgi:organic radical activating enzyme
MTKVIGQTYSSNTSKLLKHLDVIKGMQEGKAKPIMIHLSPTNVCNLKCTFCCFANRTRGEILDLDRLKKCVKDFRSLGTSALEFTGGGEPTLYPYINEAIDYSYDLGYSLGICTNGSSLRKVRDWNKFKWVRLGIYSIDNDYAIDLEYIRSFNVEISAAYVWNKPDIGKFHKMLDFVNEQKIPTRIAANAIKDPVEVESDMDILRQQCNGRLGNFAFISDFNFKTVRRNDKCYMYLIKPFVFTDGNVYACPSSELSTENNKNMNDTFKICSIEELLQFYTETGIIPKNYSCTFCKYCQQNELLEDALLETRHNEFA